MQSRPTAFETRKSCRDTWAQRGKHRRLRFIRNRLTYINNICLRLHKKIWLSANGQTSVLFILGADSKANNETKQKLLDERNTYGDIIEVDGLIEHYNNLTLKTLYTLKFFLQQGSFNLSSDI